VEIWQCDARGQYHHVGEPDRLLDLEFQGFGATLTDAEGRYAFRTIRPVPYPGRTPHIHFAVEEGGRRRLTSQMFVEGEPRNERDGLYRRLGGDARLVTLRLEAAGAALRGALDIVLA
jgi:protocatechuate 3,4-dioxygenase beta subunit